jgi:hypothetical protein
MLARNVVFLAGHALPADVGTPQVENLVWPSYQSGILSAKVAAGRANSAFNSEQVPDCREASEAPRERWSRGCRRAHVWFWFWQWFRLSPLAPKKKSRCPSRSPRKSWKPASTSNLAERACRLSAGRPAPTFGLLRNGAVVRPAFLENSATSLWAAPLRSPICPSVCHDQGHHRC